ncbi:MAG: type II toxin-antitoxin system toxin DNA ADP-ribosyl transferase DarT [Terriglobales bacterium]
MPGRVPHHPKLFHIVHVDRLPSIIADDFLWCDAKIGGGQPPGPTIGMGHIKQRRLARDLDSRPGLRVGDCVPFYFCPRSVMLYVISRGNHPDLAYTGGQEPIVHLEADLHDAVEWAESNGRGWAFTLSNAGSSMFEDRCDLAQLGQIDWHAVQARDWRRCREYKQAEFLVEQSFPWRLVERVGVLSLPMGTRVGAILSASGHQPVVEVRADWYY